MQHISGFIMPVILSSSECWFVMVQSPVGVLLRRLLVEAGSAGLVVLLGVVALVG